jgi:chromosome segregation ATPase
VSKAHILKPTLNQADIDLLMQSMRLVFPTKVEFERRFEQVDQRFEQVDQRFEQMERRFEQVDQRFENTGKETNQRFTVMDLNFAEINQRLDEIEQQQSIKYDNVITLLDDVMVELKTIREEQVMLTHRSQRHTDQIGKIKSRATNHEKRIGKLELAVNFDQA